jgi:hypothetical protein
MHANVAGESFDLTRARVFRAQRRAAICERLKHVARRQPIAVLGVLSYWTGPHVEDHGSWSDTARAPRSPSL